MVARSHWLAASDSHGNPLSSHVRVHSISTHMPARPSTTISRVGVGLPRIRGIAHHTTRYHEPTQAPTNGPSRKSPSHVTLCSHARIIVHATACAANIVH